MATLGVDVLSVEPGQVRLLLRHDDRFTQQHGFLHAGAVSSVLDTACGYAAYTVIPPDAAVLTATFTVNLLAPAAGQRFEITGEVIRPAGAWWSAAGRRSPTTASARSRSSRPP